MTRRLKFIPYRPKTILNKSKRADHWFWSRYSAYPYIGCQHGCEFCYCRERKYVPYDDPADFPYVIKVKENAPALMRAALQRTPVDVIFTGDYQPAERKYQLSRKILQVCLEMGFPVFILERSPMVLRDLDLIQAIHQKARAVVAFSIIYTTETSEYECLRKIERLSPPPEKRFEAMEKIAAAGITTGTCMMPVLPNLCDSVENIDAVVRTTANHGGEFVLAGGLTLADQQRDHFLNHLAINVPDLLQFYENLYPPGTYSPASRDSHRAAVAVRAACHKYGISDRIPRPIIPGDKRWLNKKIAEALANQAYMLEINLQSASEIWAFRKAAWSIDDLEQDVGLLYRSMGLKGLQAIPEIGSKLSGEIERLLFRFVNSNS